MAVSFASNVRPLFNQKDIDCMKPMGVLLDDYAYMSDSAGGSEFPDHENAREVYARLTGADQPRMPMGGPYWSHDQLDTFNQWMTDGFLP